MRARTLLAASVLALGILVVAVVIFREVLDSSRGGGASAPKESATAGQGEDGGTFPSGSSAPGEGSPGGSPRRASGKWAGGSSVESPSAAGSSGNPTVSGNSAGGPGTAPGAPGAAPGGSPASERPLSKGNAAIVVMVTDADGRPFAGVPVTISGAPGTRTQATDKTGASEMAEIPAGSYEVLVRPPGAPALRSYRPAALAAGERLEVRCQVPAFDAQIAGRILDAKGEPVKGIVVEARPITFPGAVLKFESTEPSSPSPASGSDGTFQIDGLARVEHALTTRETPRYPPARAVAVAGSAEPVDITVGERRSLAVLGTVIDPDGKLVSGVQVNVLTHPAAPGTSDAEGRFRVEVKYERGAVAFAARKKGYAQGEAVITAAEIGDQDEVEMALVIEPLGKTGELRGRISDPQGKPIARQVVRLHSSSLNGNYQGISGDGGEYSIQEVRIAPDYQASVNPEREWMDFSEGPFEIAEGSTRLDIVLGPLETGHLSGKMVDPGGRPISRLTLWVRSLTASSNVSTITSDEQGRFTLEEAPAGDLRFETRASPLISVQGVRLEAGESREVELLVGLGAGRLDGQVTGPDGKTAIAGARLTLSWNATRGPIQSTVFREVTSDAQGRFSFSGLSKGRGSIISSAPGYQDFRETRELTGEGEEMQVPMNTVQK